MKVKATYWKSGTEFRHPYPEGYYKIVEVDNGYDLELLEQQARDNCKKGYYLKDFVVLSRDNKDKDNE